jgi:hypothetical protein
VSLFLPKMSRMLDLSQSLLVTPHRQQCALGAQLEGVALTISRVPSGAVICR